jgi:hypothetical protein
MPLALIFRGRWAGPGRRAFEMSSRLHLALLGLLASAAPAAAQIGRSVEGYGFFAPGFRPSDGTGTFSFGGGVDWLAGEKLSFGADGHFFGWWDCSSCGALVLTGNVGYLKRRRTIDDKWEPFGRVGIGLAAVEGGGIGVPAFSGGANYWLRERVGLRVEGRYEYVFEEEGYVHIRIGVVF